MGIDTIFKVCVWGGGGLVISAHEAHEKFYPFYPEL